MRAKRLRISETSPKESPKKVVKQTQNSNGVKEASVETENTRSSSPLKSEVDPLPSIEEDPTPNPQTNLKIHKDSEVEDKSQSRSSLNLKGVKEFVPKPKENRKVREFKLELKLSPEITISLKVTPESNPYKLAEYIISQMEITNPDYFNPSSLNDSIVKNKHNVK